MSASSDEEYFDCCSEPVKYYAVACHRNKGSGIVTTDINEARKRVKSCKGSRFNSFYDPKEAQQFAEKILPEEADSGKEKKSRGQRGDPDPFPNVSSTDLNKFKEAIEAGDRSQCETLIWSNPRHLVTTSDFPPLLRSSRFHYNALHVAVTADRPTVVQLILDSLQREDFWRSLHPTTENHCNQDRMVRVIDMYLNTPDYWNSETPLHFASKFGHEDCLRVLLGQEQTERDLLNKGGLRAEEVVCDRYDRPDKEEKAARMRAMFSEKYVVLLGGDEARISRPVDHQGLRTLLSRAEGVRAFVGPLSEEAATRLRGRWSVLTAEDAVLFEEARRTDAEKGLECHGRYLARVFDAPWRELWPFLECYLDLGGDEGLGRLEAHLASRGDRSETSLGEESHSESVRALGRLSGAYASLTRLFSRLTLRERPPSPTPVIRDATAHSLRTLRTPFDTSLLGRGFLTPTDRQVRQAVLSGRGSLGNFPAVTAWLENLSAADPACQEVPPVYNGPLVTSTPFKRRPPAPQCGLSPLAGIELPE